jgi:hypothetical protein
MNWYQYAYTCIHIGVIYGTNWLASYMLLLVSKKCFLTSQGIVGAGMNHRALTNYGNHNNRDTNNEQTYQIRTTTEDRHKPANYHQRYTFCIYNM